jgi:hypothetical protein
VSDPLPELLDARGLTAELGVSRAAAEAIMRRLPLVRFEGLRKTFVRRDDVARLLDESTFGPDQVVVELRQQAGGPTRFLLSPQQTASESRSVADGKRAHRHPENEVRGEAVHRAVPPGRPHTPVRHGGSFRTMREARTRRDVIAGELAALRNPALLLDALAEPVEAPRVKTLADWAAEFTASRIDVAEGTHRNYGAHLRRILPALGERDPSSLAVSDVQTWVAEIAAALQPGSVAVYVGTLRALLDFVVSTPTRPATGA